MCHLVIQFICLGVNKIPRDTLNLVSFKKVTVINKIMNDKLKSSEEKETYKHNTNQKVHLKCELKS